MAWPSKIFVATTNLGVYYTDDFSDPDIQPTWTAVNAGLSGLWCVEFDLDPFDQLGRQYVLLGGDETLYRRENGGNWTSILTPAQARTACGQVGGTMGLKSFCADLIVPGRIWALFRWNTNTYAIRSDDYGDNWIGHLVTNVNTEDVWHIRSSGNYIWLATYAGTLYLHNDWVFYSSDLGITWNQYYTWEGHHFGYNPLTPDRIYEITGVTGTHYLTRITSGGVGTDLQTNIALPARQDSMWFDYIDPDHHRELEAGEIHVTTDEWATIDSTLGIDDDPISFAPWAGADVDQMIVGFIADDPSNHHVIGTLYGEADTVPHYIAGTNVNTPPYTDAIPYSHQNQPCERGIRALQPTVGKIHTYAVAMPGYSDIGMDRGIPDPGDRSAWDAKNYPLRHTNDINTGIHHTLGTGSGQAAPGDHVHDPTEDALTNLFAPFVVSNDGAWCWFQDPRALYYNGVTYFGYVDTSGNIKISAFNHATRLITTFTLHAALEVDDHDAPSILIRDSDKRLMVWYSKHNGTAEYLRISTNPEDITSWGAETDLDGSVGAATYDYANPAQLLGEANDPIYVFFRESDYAAADKRLLDVYKSTDGGSTWGAAIQVYTPGGVKIIYFKTVQNGDDRIDIIVTDGHPDNDGFTSLYHFYYQGGNYYKSNGTLIVAGMPFEPGDLTLVYDGTTKASWIWDVAIDVNGYPVVVFEVIETEWSDFRYYYGRWNGSSWETYEITTSGGRVGSGAGAEAYAGGIVLDHNDPSIVYYSKQVGSYWEIYKGITPDGGTSWAIQAVTNGSIVTNMRPVVVRNHPTGFTAIYMSGTYDYGAVYDTVLKYVYETFGGGGVDEKVKISNNDNTPGYLNGKLVSGANITLTEGNDGGDEILTVAATGVNLVKVSANDTTTGYLNGKLVAGGGIDLTEFNNGADETLIIASHYEVLMADGEATTTPLANDEDTDWLYGD